MRPRLFLLGLAFFAFAAHAGTSAAPETFAVAETVSGDTFTLADGRMARLAGVMAPLPATQELADKARAALQSLIGNNPVMLDGATTDRYGRTAAQAYVPGKNGAKTWLEGALLQDGLAFVYPPAGDEARLQDMLALEAKARAARKGIWADPYYADIPAKEAWKAEGRFAFISGTVLDAARVKNKIWLDFGKDFRRDFSVMIAGRNLRRFRDAGIDPLAYKGKTVRARGWVKKMPGPVIEIADPGQIGILPAR